MAEEWKKLPFAEKQRYEAMEEEDRRRYHAEMAVFNESLELGIVHDLPPSGTEGKHAGKERTKGRRGASSDSSPSRPPWANHSASQTADAAMYSVSVSLPYGRPACMWLLGSSHRSYSNADEMNVPTFANGVPQLVR